MSNKELYQFLQKSYIDEKMSCRQIADELGCSCGKVQVLLKKAGIPLRKQWEHPNHKVHITREELYEKYIIEKKERKVVCKELGCGPFVFDKYRKLYGLGVHLREKKKDIPRVSKSKLRGKKSLSVTHPHLLEEWDWEYNNFIEVFPDEVTP
jgi:hypothetical protein